MNKVESRLQRLERAYPVHSDEPSEAELERICIDMSDTQLTKSMARMQFVRELAFNERQGEWAAHDDSFISEVDELADSGEFEQAWHMLNQRLEILVAKEIEAYDGNRT